MTRRPLIDPDEALLSDAPSSAVAALLDVTPSRVRQRRAALGVAGTNGRPRSPSSRAARAALGSRVVVDAAAVGLGPVEYLDAAQEMITPNAPTGGRSGG